MLVYIGSTEFDRMSRTVVYDTFRRKEGSGKERPSAGFVANFFPLIVSNIQAAHQGFQGLQKSLVYGFGSTPDLVNHHLVECVGFLVIPLFASMHQGVRFVVRRENGVSKHACKKPSAVSEKRSHSVQKTRNLISP